jgi:multiple sugar transport system ATP-binding protein
VEAVLDLSLDCKDKEFFSLLGPSGCGKSSTLRMIAGLEEISQGEILIGDHVVNEVEPKDRDIAMVFETYALYPHKKVFANMAFPLRVGKQKYSDAEIKKRVEKAAEILEITDFLDRYPKQLSGGQRQRVAIGRAIVREPQVFLLDEPISHLDAKLRTHMRGELKLLQRTLGTTMIYVTHDQMEAMSMADRIAIMNFGVLQQVGTPFEIFNRPVNQFVAGFVGDPPMNFIDCDLDVTGEKWQLVNESFRISLPSDLIDRYKENNGDPSSKPKEVVLGVRPENFIVSGKKGGEDNFPADVIVTEPLGEEMIVDIEIPNNKLKLKVSVDHDIKMGDKIWLDVMKNKMHLFNRETEKAYF